LRSLLAALLGPVVVFLLIVGLWRYYSRYHYKPMSAAAAVVAYLFAQALFWPPALATNFIGRQLGFKALPRFVILMAVLSALLSVLLDGMGLFLHYDPGSWRSISRNAGNLGLAGAGAYILYRVVLGPEAWGRTPNNRWRGP
jgi:hypothetical protein